MKKLSLVTVIAVLLSLSSCQVIEGIFKAGVWVGILFVVAIIGVILFVISKATGGK
jgi:hypothetical protein